MNMCNEECLTIFQIFIPPFLLQTVHNQILQEYRKIKKVKKNASSQHTKWKLLWSPHSEVLLCLSVVFSPTPSFFFSPIPTTTRRRVAASISTTSWLTSRSSYRSTTSSSCAPPTRPSTELFFFHRREQYSLAATKTEVSTAELENL